MSHPDCKTCQKKNAPPTWQEANERLAAKAKTLREEYPEKSATEWDAIPEACRLLPREGAIYGGPSRTFLEEEGEI